MTHIFIANITIKAKTALKIASGQKDFLQDSPIQKDWNNLPMILGTSLAGVLRKELDEKLANELFGDENAKKKDSKGSKLIISNALLLNENREVNEGLILEKSKFLKEFEILPRREHTAINAKGTTVNNSKFDEEVVFAGSEFKFSISLLTNNPEEDKKSFEMILNLLSTSHLRIGGGSTKGFGQIKVKKIDYKLFDMASKEFADFENSLNTKSLIESYDIKAVQSEKYTTYKVSLEADDFFMFGSGFGDSEADMTPIYEKQVDYENKCFTHKKVLIPASSIKGAISHRTTFYYNKEHDIFIESNKKPFEVVESIFGAKKDSDNGLKGKIIISDAYLEEVQTKVFDHVSIDRFTGGAIDGALFQEKTISSKEKIKLEILLNNDINDNEAIEAFKSALTDLTSGMLSLGGATTKGHGVFTGEWKKC